MTPSMLVSKIEHILRGADNSSATDKRVAAYTSAIAAVEAHVDSEHAALIAERNALRVRLAALLAARDRWATSLETIGLSALADELRTQVTA